MEFIVTGAAIKMFSVKLVFPLYLSSVFPEIYFGMQLYADGFVIMVSSKEILFLTCSSSPSKFTPIANNTIVSAFSIFSNMI